MLPIVIVTMCGLFIAALMAFWVRKQFTPWEAVPRLPSESLEQPIPPERVDQPDL